MFNSNIRRRPIGGKCRYDVVIQQVAAAGLWLKNEASIGISVATDFM